MAARDGMNQSITVGRLAVRWFLGGVVGTCLIAFSRLGLSAVISHLWLIQYERHGPAP